MGVFYPSGRHDFVQMRRMAGDVDHDDDDLGEDAGEEEGDDD